MAPADEPPSTETGRPSGTDAIRSGLEALPVEDRLFVLCCRSALDEVRRTLLAEVAGGGIDWGYVVRKGTYHRLLGLVLHHLRSADLLDAVPQEARRALHAAATADAQARRRQEETLRACDDAFGSCEIDYLLLKGPALQPLYPVDVDRPSGDIDLMVREGDLDTVFTALQNTGLRLATRVPPDLTGSEALRFAQYFEQLRFENENGDEVELHFRLYNYGVPDTREAAWDRVARWPAAGREVPGPGLEDLFLYLVTHVNLHAFGRVLWYLDVAEFYERWRERVDWDVLARRADERGLSSSFYHSLLWILQLLRPEHSPVSLDRFRPSSRVSRLFRRRWRRGEVMALSSYIRPFDAARYYLLGNASPTDKARYLARVLAPPARWLGAHLGRPPRPWLLLTYLRQRRRERRRWGKITRADRLLMPPARLRAGGE